MRSLMIAAGVVGSLLAAPAATAAPTDRTTAFLFDADSGKGLVTVTQGSETELAFNLFGLEPGTKYRVVVSSRGCSSSKGTITSRTFRTTSRGSSWDPVAVQSAAVPKSARIVRASTGKTVACSSRPRISSSGPKITGATPGVLAVSQTDDAWRLALSIGGLKPRAGYRIVALEGGCAASAPVLERAAFRSDAGGFALVDVKTAAVADKTIGAVGVVQRSDREVVFCKVL